MKKVIYFILLSALSLSVVFAVNTEAQARSCTESYKQYTQRAEKDIKNLLMKQVELSNKNDIKALENFYAEDYRNSDAFDKTTTFALIKDNYKIYPDLKVSLKINNIEVNGKYAVADVYEYASKNNIKRDDIDYKGKLKAEGRTLYYLENRNGKWLITSEQSIYEKNSVTFGEADYADVKLITPMIVSAGEQYSAELKINNLPGTAVVMGSITTTPATYPIPEEDDTNDPYRVFEDTSLERIFFANRDNINEYVAGTLGITRSKPVPNGDIKLYMSGLAFLMTKVNVIPENTKYIPEKNIVEVVQRQLEDIEQDSIEPDDILPNDEFVKESAGVND